MLLLVSHTSVYRLWDYLKKIRGLELTPACHLIKPPIVIITTERMKIQDTQDKDNKIGMWANNNANKIIILATILPSQSMNTRESSELSQCGLIGVSNNGLWTLGSPMLSYSVLTKQIICGSIEEGIPHRTRRGWRGCPPTSLCTAAPVMTMAGNWVSYWHTYHTNRYDRLSIHTEQTLSQGL